MLGSIGAEEVCVIDVSKANIDKAAVAFFREEVSQAVRYGLFPFAAPADDGIGSSFKVTRPGESEDEARSAFSMCCQKQDPVGFGSKDIMDIQAGDTFRFSFYRKGSEGNFTHFSTNLFPRLFKILLCSCPRTATHLYQSLKDSEYFILSPETAKKEFIGKDPYLSGPHPDIDLSQTIANDIIDHLDWLLYKEHVHFNFIPSEMKKHLEISAKIFQAYQKRCNKQEQELDRETLSNPLNPTTISYVAKHELMPQLTQADIFSHLPPKPVIIDVGSACGTNLRTIGNAIKDPIMLGIDPISEDIQRKTYIGRIEHISELHQTADLVTVFKVQVKNYCDEFYAALPRLVAPGGKVLVGVHYADPPATWNGKTVHENLRKHFGKVTVLPNPHYYTQTLYLATEPKEAQMPAPLDAFIEAYKSHMVSFIEKQKAERVQTPEDIRNDVILLAFLAKVGEVYPERVPNPSQVLVSASSSKNPQSMERAS